MKSPSAKGGQVMGKTTRERDSRSRRVSRASAGSTGVLREIALQLPEVEDATTQRGVAFKARGRLLACAAIHASAEPGSVVVRIGAEQRARLLAKYPDALYLPAHYAKHPAVLARLERLDRESLREILGAAWLHVTEQAVGGGRSGSRRSSPRRRS
jgi:hypothetical protein